MTILSLPQGIDPTQPEALHPTHLGQHTIETIRTAGGTITSTLVSSNLTRQLEPDQELTLFPHIVWEYEISAQLVVAGATFSNRGAEAKRVNKGLGGHKWLQDLSDTPTRLRAEEENYHARTHAGLTRLALLLAAGPNQQPLGFVIPNEIKGKPLDTSRSNNTQALVENTPDQFGFGWLRDDQRPDQTILLAKSNSPLGTLQLTEIIMDRAGIPDSRLKITEAFGITRRQYNLVYTLADFCQGHEATAQASRRVLELANNPDAGL